MESVVALLMLIGAVAFAISASVVLNGYVLSVLWGWFIVPVFGLPALTIPVAIGIALVISFLTHQLNLNDGDETGWKQLAFSFLHPLLTLLAGWIVKQWM